MELSVSLPHWILFHRCFHYLARVRMLLPLPPYSVAVDTALGNQAFHFHIHLDTEVLKEEILVACWD